LHSYMRGGNWSNTTNTGVLSLWMSDTPSSAFSHIGFRVAK
jgi:formylglycine-generating enzyme required for sulfatase activity